MEKKENKNPKRKKLFMLLGIGLGVCALGGGFTYWYFKGRKGNDSIDPETDFLSPAVNDAPTNTPKKTPPKSKTVVPLPPKPSVPVPNPVNPVSQPPVKGDNRFPLKPGSKNDLVKMVQDALVLKYGKAIMPKYGSDGQFGKELSSALLSKGFPATIDESTFDKIIGLNAAVKPISTKGLTPEQTTQIDIVKNIWLNCTLKKLALLLAQLKRIANVPAYVKVNELFKTIRLNGVKQTIVNATLSIFTDDTAKQLLRAEFLRIGLKYDGEKWSLAGVTEKQIITNQETTICSLKGITLEVPSETILGVEIGRIRNLTHFRTLDNQVLYVPTKHINYV